MFFFCVFVFFAWPCLSDLGHPFWSVGKSRFRLVREPHMRPSQPHQHMPGIRRVPESAFVPRNAQASGCMPISYTSRQAVFFCLCMHMPMFKCYQITWIAAAFSRLLFVKILTAPLKRSRSEYVRNTDNWRHSPCVCVFFLFAAEVYPDPGRPMFCAIPHNWQDASQKERP